MILSIFYIRPKKVDLKAFRQGHESLHDGREDSASKPGSPIRPAAAGIPESLSFDNILKGGSCPPMTVRDFMNYLVYVERAAENLQFYLWFKDFERRFAEAQTADIALAPEWTQSMEDEAIANIRRGQAEKFRSDPLITSAALSWDTTFDEGKKVRPMETMSSFHTPPPSSHSSESDAESAATLWTGNPSAGATAHASNLTVQTAQVFRSAGATPPFTIQPFREETDRVIVTYIADHSPRQLNLSAWEKKASLHALSYTTHPSAFRLIFKAVDVSLRQQAHPNFVRWSICNGNPARVFFARSLGAGLVLAGLVLAVVLTLGDGPRGYRALAAIFWIAGAATLIAAYKGMCVVLHGMHHRHVRPWELFLPADKNVVVDVGKKQNPSFDPFGAGNSYEDEPWVIKYKERNVLRKIFDREVWIQEPALRRVQDAIFIQAVVLAVLVGGGLTAVFVAVPGARLF